MLYKLLIYSANNIYKNKLAKMEAFYGKFTELFKSLINKNEAIICQIETVKEKYCQMLDELSSHNDAIIDEIQLFQQSATKEFKTICSEYVPKGSLGDLEQRANNAEQNAIHLSNDQTTYLKKIEDLEFEVKNLKSVSLLSQKDKYNRTLQIEVENLERKLKAADAKYKALEDRLTTVQKNSKIVEPVDAVAEPVDAVAEPIDAKPEQVSISKSINRCYARIGSDKITVDSLSQDEIAAYPTDVYKSKTGKFVGRPCINIVSAPNGIFCQEHINGFQDIRVEPPSDGTKPKKKKKAESSESTSATSNSADASVSPAIASSESIIEQPSAPVEQPTKEKKSRKKKTTSTEENIIVVVDTTVNNDIQQTQDSSQTIAPEEKVKKPRKKKTDTVTPQVPVDAINVDEEQEQVKTPSSTSSTPGAKRGRKKKETPPTPTRAPVSQVEHTLQKVDSNIRPSKPDWAFIEPWDAPDGTQYVVDIKTNYVFEATDTGDIGAFTGFMRT